MKYRLLTLEELEELRPEFIQFLAANTITADDWTSLQQNNPNRAAEIIEIFSDLVLEKALQKISYIEHREKTSLMTFQCLEDKMVLIGLNIEGEADLTDENYIKEVNEDPSILQSLSLKIFKSEKGYIQAREEEIFNLLKSGGLISDGKMFILLDSINTPPN